MPTSTAVVQLIEALHESPIKLSINICGAGVSALAALTQVANCSRTLLRGEVLYSPQATATALDYTPRHHVSRVTAKHLAQHAFHNSMRLLRGQHKAEEVPLAVVGVGATSAVQTTRQRKGVDQAFVSVWGAVPSSAPDASDTATATTAPTAMLAVLDAYLRLPPDMPREQQDEQVALLILHAIGRFATEASANGGAIPIGVPWTWDLNRHSRDRGGDDSRNAETLLCADPQVEWYSLREACSPLSSTVERAYAVAIQAVLDGTSPVALFNRHGEARACAEPLLFPESDVRDSAPPPSPGAARPIRLLYPGSFRPLHWGHTELARAATQVCAEHFSLAHGGGGAPDGLVDCHVTYEIAAKIVDKGAVTAAELRARVSQFVERGDRVAITAATLFVEKAALFPNHGFIVGVDTAKRILSPQYYEGKTEEGMIAALKRDIGGRGCYFVVGGRSVAQPNGDTVWEDLRTLTVPDALAELFLSVPEERFRVDISSTELRARHKHSTV